MRVCGNWPASVNPRIIPNNPETIPHNTKAQFDMKTLMPVIPMIAALALFEGTARCEQESEAALPRIDQIMQQVATETQRTAADAEKQMKAAQRQLDQMDSQMASALDRYQKLVQDSGRRTSMAVSQAAVPVEPLSGVATVQGRTTLRRTAGGPDKALVLRSADTDAAAQANLEEDLAVMLRVFDKSIEGFRGNKNRSV